MTLQRLCKKLKQENVGDTFIEFCSNLSTYYDKHKFQCPVIYKVDETAVTTVKSNWNRIKARYEEGRAVTSAERGSLVTMAVAVNANGNSIPPFFVFPRKTTGIGSL